MLRETLFETRNSLHIEPRHGVQQQKSKTSQNAQAGLKSLYENA
jgi:hypothetical protein